MNATIVKRRGPFGKLKGLPAAFIKEMKMDG